jgi:hypothetical protein
MKEVQIGVWLVAALLLGFLFFRMIKWQKRALNRYVMLYKLGFLLLFALTGLGIGYFVSGSPHSIWASRLLFIGIGALHLGLLYQQSWAVRHSYKAEQDSFWVECTFTLLMGVLGAIACTYGAKFTRWLAIGAAEDLQLPWEMPLLVLLPFLLLKLGDLSSQIPYRVVEHAWVFPIEPAQTQDWPRHDLVQVNFQVSTSLQDEYRLLATPAAPWIEVPREAPLGSVFRLLIQERRIRTELKSIRDVGDEFDGSPGFWWLFSIKRIWWKPWTWFRKSRYLNPALSLVENHVQEGDIILGRRIPLEAIQHHQPDVPLDPDKTELIKR